MKKLFILFALVLVVTTAQAQFKIHDDGQVSLGSLNKTYGIQALPSGRSYFRSTSYGEFSCVAISYSNIGRQKHWVVANLADNTNPGAHTFYVTGHGYVYSSGSYRQSDATLQQECSEIDSAGYVLDQITGIRYTPVGEENGTEKMGNRRIGLIGQEVEKVLPEAMIKDENGLFYVDYEALTVLLIEAVKEQRQEIKELRNILRENGFQK